MEHNKKRAVQTAIGCILIMLLHNGHSAMFTLHMPYMAESLGVDPSGIGLCASISTIVAFFISMFVARPLIKKVSPKYALIIASVGTLLNVIVLYMATSLGMVWFSSVFAGAKQAVGTIMCASLILAEYRGIWKDSLPKVTGIVSSAAGLGGTIMLLICGRTLSSWGWRINYFVYGAIAAVLAIFINLLMIRKPLPGGQAPEAVTDSIPGDSRPTGDGLVLKEALRTPSLYFLMIGIALCNMLYSGTVSYLPTYLIGLGFDSVQASSYASMNTFFSMLSLLISGFLIAKFGIKGFTCITFCGSIVGVALLSSYMDMQAAWIIAVGIVFLTLGATVTTLSSQLVPVIFGTKDFAGINPFANGAYFLGVGVSSYAVGRIAEVAGTFRVAHIVSIICGALGLISVLIAIKLAPYKGSRAENTAEKA